jgi:glycosyltransferase involved in cell wall biosynthesis
MRILWHSAAPWLPTGYATQTATWCRYLRAQGHDVAISSYYGNPGQRRTWEMMPVYPCPMEGNVAALILGHAAKHKADVIVLLADVWLMNPMAFQSIPTIAWIPIDCDPLSIGDTAFLANAPETIIPVAMSGHGQRMLAKAGADAPLIPHAIDTSVFTPDPQREALRAAFGIAPGQFAIGMNFNNIDPYRKATPEQLLAFKHFHARHPDSVMFCHTMERMKGSLDIPALIASLGLGDHVRVSNQYRMQAGEFSTADMARWYGAMDVVSNATMGEGFGLPAIEAQACGTPVVLADNTTGPDLAGPGWLAQCEPFWNFVHGAWWHRPLIHSIEKAYEKAWAAKATFKRDACRAFAERYSVTQVGPLWDGLLADVRAGKVAA